jgi:hypothetical protein
MDTRYAVRGQAFSACDPRLQGALARVYESSERPRCLCVQGGVEMYIARHGEFVIKRMPGTGHLHHATCPSFEPEAGDSGLGELLGEAIVEHAPEEVEIRTAFPLARLNGKPMPKGEPSDDPVVVNAPRKRMSLRAVLHFLYDRAGFNRWYPAMEGRRSQAVIHRYLTAAAKGITLKGGTLEERLYVPEPFRSADADAIGQRRRRKLALLMSPEADVGFKMAIVVGQFNGVEATEHGRQILIKHMPDAPLNIDTKAWEKAERGYRPLLQALDADVERKPKVVVAALIYAKRERLYQVDTLTMMLVTDQWIPLDGLYELELVEELRQQGRAFFKPLKFDAKTAAGFPNVLLLDAGPQPLPMHVVSPFADPKDRAIKEKVIKACRQPPWVWETDKPIPGFPRRGLSGHSGNADREAPRTAPRADSGAASTDVAQEVPHAGGDWAASEPDVSVEDSAGGEAVAADGEKEAAS